jgi:hypothetical protein
MRKREIESTGPRTMRIWRTFALAAASTAASLDGAARASTPDDSALAIAQKLLRHENIQTEIPHRLDESRGPMLFHLPHTLGEFILWGAAIAGAVAIGYSVRDSLPGWDRSRQLTAEQTSDEASGSETPTLLGARDEADGLARNGRFDEAMHVLLLQAVAELRDKLKLSISDSLTAREIERRAPLDPSGKTAFGRMVRAVEHVVFGQEPVDERAYRACRADFELFAASLKSGARA